MSDFLKGVVLAVCLDELNASWDALCEDDGRDAKDRNDAAEIAYRQANSALRDLL